jgi:dihydropteroate synthase
MTRTLTCGPFTFALDRALVMGIVNITADSFSDGGQFLSGDAAFAHAMKLHDEGADIVDLGGESTRPGAAEVPEAEELARVLPAVERLALEGIAVSVDTQKPGVMERAIDAGAAMINDVNAFRAPGAIAAVAPSGAGLAVMHMQGTPATMQADPQYADVVTEVGDFLLARAAELEAAGVAKGRIVIDPGFGFGKTLGHNKELFRGLRLLAGSGYPVMAGLSRKSTLGTITGRPVGERLSASVAAAMLAVQNGALIVRVHDVRETVDALKVLAAFGEAR